MDDVDGALPTLDREFLIDRAGTLSPRLQAVVDTGLLLPQRVSRDNDSREAMGIEIHQPDIERRVCEGLQSGRFRDLDELLTRALRCAWSVTRSWRSARLVAMPVSRFSFVDGHHNLPNARRYFGSLL